ncbi:hypothetical protein FKP32DRAFT_510489 [Trametes sanguinea]|nr:hypothetical protein FKP32DRAFT_510489 [Trametes sanguinea]
MFVLFECLDAAVYVLGRWANSGTAKESPFRARTLLVYCYRMYDSDLHSQRCLPANEARRAPRRARATSEAPYRRHGRTDEAAVGRCVPCIHNLEYAYPLAPVHACVSFWTSRGSVGVSALSGAWTRGRGRGCAIWLSAAAVAEYADCSGRAPPFGGVRD